MASLFILKPGGNSKGSVPCSKAGAKMFVNRSVRKDF